METKNVETKNESKVLTCTVAWWNIHNCKALVIDFQVEGGRLLTELKSQRPTYERKYFNKLQEQQGQYFCSILYL